MQADYTIPFEQSSNCCSLQQHKHTKVLCIDDDPDIAEGLRRNFRKEGIEALFAYHGMQGYWIACTENPDVIVIDLRMPKGNGEDVIQSLRQNTVTSHIPIIVLSGAQSFGIEQRVLDLGADCYLKKPAHFSELIQSIHQVT